MSREPFAAEPSRGRPAVVCRLTLRGQAGGGGTACGPARVLRRGQREAVVRPGEILICGVMLPDWLPLLATAAGLVTATGGILSNPAIVAREYGRPLVTGAGAAVAAIRDGDLIALDGATGLVHLLSIV